MLLTGKTGQQKQKLLADFLQSEESPPLEGVGGGLAHCR
jgi:hypothetical protein